VAASSITHKTRIKNEKGTTICKINRLQLVHLKQLYKKKFTETTINYIKTKYNENKHVCLFVFE